VRTLTGHTAVVRGVQPRRRLLASGSDDWTIKLWDISDLVGR
jgi:WD40 repeat protein